MGSNESHESHEGGKRRRRKGHDSNSRLPVRCRDHWLETEGREGSCGGHGRRSSRSVEKGWLFQDCRCAQLEAEVQDREGPSNEKVQGVGELMMRALCSPCSRSNLELFWSWWAVSPGLGE